MVQPYAAEPEQKPWYTQRGGLFVPLQAIDAFLQKMRLTLSDIKSRPGLAAAVAAYHGEGDTPQGLRRNTTMFLAFLAVTSIAPPMVWH